MMMKGMVRFLIIEFLLLVCGVKSKVPDIEWENMR